MGAAWGQSFSYDGFGNLTDKNVTAGAAPVLHVTVNAATNRFTGVNFGYDANGNLAYAGSVDANYGFDEENRLVTQWNPSAVTSESYSYGPDNQRVWKRRTNGTEEVTFYGLRGERLGTFQPSYANHDVLTGATAPLLYFAGRPVSYGADRLGSKRADAPNTQGQTISHTYFPYGEEYTTTTQDTEKFGTYYRDSTTALDYARNRFYSNRLARFLTADPYRNSAGPADPGSWNRYAYTLGDPVNSNDPSGLDCQLVDSGTGIFMLLCSYSGDMGGAEGGGPHRAYSDSDGRGGGGGGGGGVDSKWGDTFNCIKTAAQVLNYLEHNFASLASTIVDIGPAANIVNFTAPSGITAGATVTASVTTVVGANVIQPPLGSAQLVVQSVGSGGFTLQPNPQVSPLNGTLSFSVTNAPNDQISFRVQANAAYSSLGARLLSFLGKPLESGIWNHLVDRIKDYCNKK